MDISRVLLVMNGYSFSHYLEYPAYAPRVALLAKAIEQGQKTPEMVVTELFRLALIRDPSPKEMVRFRSHFREREPARAVSDVIWVLINHPEFFLK